MNRAEIIFEKLCNDFGLKGANGSIKFHLKDFEITVEQNNIVGNILEEWLAKWLKQNNIPHEYNHGQSSPDFWLNPNNKNSDWLEIKSFTGSPNFDVAAFRSFINLIIDAPWKLHSKFLLIKYKMEDGIIEIEDCWLKNLWEICGTSERWPVKVQYKNRVIVNIRPAVWYSQNPDVKTFESLEDFLAVLEQTIYSYHDTNAIAENWLDRMVKSYKKYFNVELSVPRWNDIKVNYGR